VLESLDAKEYLVTANLWYPDQAWLACERGIWGPHLIVVPTSVMLNWEMEIKKFCPAFKILTYYGTQKERKLKRQVRAATTPIPITLFLDQDVVSSLQESHLLRHAEGEEVEATGARSNHTYTYNAVPRSRRGVQPSRVSPTTARSRSGS